MERQEERELEPQPASEPSPAKRPYEPPKVESVQLSQDAAEALT